MSIAAIKKDLLVNTFNKINRRAHVLSLGASTVLVFAMTVEALATGGASSTLFWIGLAVGAFAAYGTGRLVGFATRSEVRPRIRFGCSLIATLNIAILLFLGLGLWQSMVGVPSPVNAESVIETDTEAFKGMVYFAGINGVMAWICAGVARRNVLFTLGLA